MTMTSMKTLMKTSMMMMTITMMGSTTTSYGIAECGAGRRAPPVQFSVNFLLPVVLTGEQIFTPDCLIVLQLAI